MTYPAGYLLTWPSGNVTASVGMRMPPKYRNVLVEPFWKDPPLGGPQPEYAAAADELARRLGPGDAALYAEIARAVVDAAMGLGDFSINPRQPDAGTSKE